MDPFDKTTQQRGGPLGDDYPNHQAEPCAEGFHCPPPRTHSERLLTKLIGRDKAYVVSQVTNATVGVASMAIVPMIFAATLVMVSHRPTIENISLKDALVQSIVVPAGVPQRIESPISLEAKTSHAVYSAELRDKSGRVVYTWPTLTANNQDRLMRGLSYTLPTNLPPGDYHLSVEVHYSVNPLVDGMLSTDIAHIQVTEDF